MPNSADTGNVHILGQTAGSLLMRLPQPRETIDQLEKAARCRQEDADALNRAQRHYWAVYTLGYVNEIILKTAYFHLYGLQTHEDTSEVREHARRRASDLQLLITAGNFHKLLFWAHMVVAQRDSLGRPFDVAFANELAVRVNRIAHHWREDLRYSASLDAESELKIVLESTAWITKHYRQLWRT